jgi:ABC-2 type transport system ATP-binding protein
MMAIETTGLTKYYGRRTAVDAVALKVPEACIYGFVGPNGAGKTTVMRMLLGLIRPDCGAVTIFGRNVAVNRTETLSRVGAAIESPALYNHISGRANLRLTCMLLDLPVKEADRVLDVVDLLKAADDKVGIYSLGMKQRLAIARTLLGTPRLLLLDEPTNGLDPDGIIAMRAFLRALPDRIRGTVFLSSHLLSEVEQIADHVGLMHNGRLIVQDRVASLVGTSANYAIDLDLCDRAHLILKAAGFNAIQKSGRIMLICPHGEEGKKQAARANQILVQAGHAVSLLAPRPTTLEEVYRRAITRNIIDERKAA